MTAKVLFLGGGRRVELAHRFVWSEFEVFGYEFGQQVPLAQEGYKVISGLRWDHPDIENDLARCCRAHGIGLILPLNDQAAAIAPTLHLPSRVVGSLAAQTCYDKLRFHQFCEEHFAAVYPSPRKGESCIVKPRFGAGSKGIVGPVGFQGWVPDGMIAQRFIKGLEYTVDCYFNLDGKMIGASPRLRERVAGGEVLDSVTVSHPEMMEISQGLGEALGVRGPVCFQFIADADGRPWVIECNHRFGGGSTLSCQAGLNLIGYLKQEYILGQIITPNCVPVSVNPGYRMRRSYRDHFFLRG